MRRKAIAERLSDTLFWLVSEMLTVRGVRKIRSFSFSERILLSVQQFSSRETERRRFSILLKTFESEVALAIQSQTIGEGTSIQREWNDFSCQRLLTPKTSVETKESFLGS